MKREECKNGTIVRTRNGIVGKIIMDDGSNCLPIRVQFLDGGTEPCNHEELTIVADVQKRTFRKGDKVRYVPRGREDYVSQPDEDKTYEVSDNERDMGWVDLKGHGYSNCVKWFDLELVEPVNEPPYYVKTGIVYRRKDEEHVATFSYAKLSKEKADRLAQMVCDKLNKMEA